MGLTHFRKCSLNIDKVEETLTFLKLWMFLLYAGFGEDFPLPF